MEAAHWGWQLARVLVPSILIVVGWVVVSNEHDKRETRKETRSFLDKTISSVEEIRDLAFSYFTSSCELEAGALGAKIDPLLMRLEKNLQFLNLTGGNNAVVNALQLRQAITSHNAYKTEPRRVLKCTDSALMQMNMHAHELISELEIAYKKQFQK